MRRIPSLALMLFAAWSFTPAASAVAGDPVRGKRVFGRCVGCHSPTGEIKIGPPLAGISGRKAASVRGFAYSNPLAASGLVWTDANLDRFLSAPRQLVPGTLMTVQLPDAKDRADLIAYLQTIPAPDHGSPQR